MADDPTPGRAAIARRFADLWQSLVKDGDAKRSGQDRRILLDQVRNALDRGLVGLSDEAVSIIGNTFSVETVIRRGERTTVHRARHRDLGSRHAIKTLNPDHADDPVARRLFLQEAATGLSLRHRHIAATQILLRLEDGRPALVMEWCQSSLADRLAISALPSDDIKRIAIALLEGLSALHDQSIVHCDLSPANILFADDRPESLRVADFGIALRAGQRHGDLDIGFAGQVHFAAPEQKDGAAVDPRADLYSAGRILLLLLENATEVATAELRHLAEHLSRDKPDERPEHAKAALRMLGGL